MADATEDLDWPEPDETVEVEQCGPKPQVPLVGLMSQRWVADDDYGQWMGYFRSAVDGRHVVTLNDGERTEAVVLLGVVAEFGLKRVIYQPHDPERTTQLLLPGNNRQGIRARQIIHELRASAYIVTLDELRKVMPLPPRGGEWLSADPRRPALPGWFLSVVPLEGMIATHIHGPGRSLFLPLEEPWVRFNQRGSACRLEVYDFENADGYILTMEARFMPQAFVQYDSAFIRGREVMEVYKDEIYERFGHSARESVKAVWSFNHVNGYHCLSWSAYHDDTTLGLPEDELKGFVVNNGPGPSKEVLSSRHCDYIAVPDPPYWLVFHIRGLGRRYSTRSARARLIRLVSDIVFTR